MSALVRAIGSVPLVGNCGGGNGCVGVFRVAGRNDGTQGINGILIKRNNIDFVRRRRNLNTLLFWQQQQQQKRKWQSEGISSILVGGGRHHHDHHHRSLSVSSFVSREEIEGKKKKEEEEEDYGGFGSSSFSSSFNEGIEDTEEELSDDDSVLEEADFDPASVIAKIGEMMERKLYLGPQYRRLCFEQGLLFQDVVHMYVQHLQFIHQRVATLRQVDNNNNNNNSSNRSKDENPVEIAVQIHPNVSPGIILRFLSPEVTDRALKLLIRSKHETYFVSRRVRYIEKLLGFIGLTPLTDALSFRLVEVNGKSGNIGRTLDLLELRRRRGYPLNANNFSLYREYYFAVTSIQAAGEYIRTNRNRFLTERLQPLLDNPTRWLDAILLNMSQRNVQLTNDLANRMLHCYTATGRSSQALHYFFSMEHIPVLSSTNDHDRDNQQTRLRMVMRAPPPDHKVPSRNGMVTGLRPKPISRLEWEMEHDFSIPLTAAFAFADSLTYGAFNHDPITLNIVSWNTLVKICCYKGALQRAIQILRVTMPKKHGIDPDIDTYNVILNGLARVGDTKMIMDLIIEMTNKSIRLNRFVVEAAVDAHLNMGDISEAITLVQDMFNQHEVLPPYSTHLKILEFALTNDLLHEAKRHVYFLQQLWHYTPTKLPRETFHAIGTVKRGERLSKEALQKLFAYHGEELKDDDFL